MAEQIKAPGLLRKLNLLDSVFLVIGGIIGSGIFMTTGIIAEYLPSPGMIIIVWLLGGVITLTGALTFAELGAMFPKAGGQYVYLFESYGPLAGFLYGWGFFWVIECGGIAALAVAFGEYFGYFLPFLSTKSILIEFTYLGYHYTLSAGQLVAITAIIVLSIVNYFGVKSGAIVQNIFTALRIVAIVALVLLGLLIGKKAGLTNLSQFTAIDKGFDYKLFGLAIIAVLWTFDGWYALNCTAEEVKNPKRNIPLGLMLGTLSVTMIYLLMNIVYLIAIPIDRMKGVERIGELASTQLFGSTATFFIAGIIMISIFGCLSATIIYGPRVYYAMAKDRAFFQNMRYIHPKYHTPTKSILWQAVWASLLCLTGTFQDLYEYVIFAVVIFFAATGLSIFVLRRKQPETPRPYKMWGYPIVPIVFIAINVAVFLNTIQTQPLQSLIGLGILLLGLPAFYYWQSKKTSNE